MVQNFSEKSCRKIWWNGNFGSTFATANGERRFPTAKAAKKKFWRSRKKLLPLQNPPPEWRRAEIRPLK